MTTPNINYQEKPVYELVAPSDGTWINRWRNRRVTPPTPDAPRISDNAHQNRMTVSMDEQIENTLAHLKEERDEHRDSRFPGVIVYHD